MYGTVAWMTVKAGKIDEFDASIAEHLRNQFVSGYIAGYLFHLDRDPLGVIMVAIFDSREAYHANAADPKQHGLYLATRQLLKADPDWRDGDAEPFMTVSNSPSRAAYGTVSTMRVLPGQRSEWRNATQRLAPEVRQTPGAVVDYLFALDRDPDEFVIVSIFDSRASYWANARDPKQDRRYREFRRFLVEDPTWHDGAVKPFLRFG
jgi:quinol monooxygenase YgiN